MRGIGVGNKPVILLSLSGAAWATISSLAVFPHSISYFNEMAGGPNKGHEHLLDSNVAWGQDLLYLKRWVDAHPEAWPLQIAAFGWVDPRLAGIEFTLPPIGPNRSHAFRASDIALELGPQPGWYAIDVNFLHGTHWPAPNGKGGWRDIPTTGLNYEYFQRFEPVDRVAYSFLIYHISLEEANRVRAEFGLSLLPLKSEHPETP